MDMQATPKQLHASLEVLYNVAGSEYGTGFSDATAHIGGMVGGIYTPEIIEEAHAGMLDPNAAGYVASYAEGYIAQWNRLTLLTNAALKAEGLDCRE